MHGGKRINFLAKSYSLSLKPSLGILLCKIENGGDDFSKFLFKKPIEEIKILLLIQGSKQREKLLRAVNKHILEHISLVDNNCPIEKLRAGLHGGGL